MKSAHRTGCHLTLTLTHTLLRGGDVADFCSGWHWHLDALQAGIDGIATPWSKHAWQALRAAYVERL